MFGHVPLLASAPYADFLEAYGKGGQRAMGLGMLRNLARLYWYTVEFGLIRTETGLRIFGAGIMSSVAESIFSLDDASPNRLAFDLERVMVGVGVPASRQRAGPFDRNSGASLEITLELTRYDHARTLLTDESV